MPKRGVIAGTKRKGKKGEKKERKEKKKKEKKRKGKEKKKKQRKRIEIVISSQGQKIEFARNKRLFPEGAKVNKRLFCAKLYSIFCAS